MLSCRRVMQRVLIRTRKYRLRVGISSRAVRSRSRLLVWDLIETVRYRERLSRLEEGSIRRIRSQLKLTSWLWNCPWLPIQRWRMTCCLRMRRMKITNQARADSIKIGASPRRFLLRKMTIGTSRYLYRMNLSPNRQSRTWASRR